MITNLNEYFSTHRPEQCIYSTQWLMEKVSKLNPKVYMEVGCAHLDTFRLYESILDSEGLAIGIDLVNKGRLWDNYESHSGCEVTLISGDSTSASVVSEVIKELGGKKIDFLFIDGNHYIEYVEKDWDNFSPLVRSGGLIALHDVDMGAYSRGDLEGQGGAHVTQKAQGFGYKVEFPPKSIIGMSVITMK